MPYITFLAAGTVCYSTMNSATFEALYSAFSRMHVQRTWDAIMNAPVSLDDIVFAETLWAAAKSFLSGMAILLIIWILGLSHSALVLWLIPLTVLIGLTFGSLGLTMTALSPSYDFFLYYFTLAITPMVLLCGVFFPVSQLPPFLQQVSTAAPAQSCHRARAASGQRRGACGRAAARRRCWPPTRWPAFYAALVLARRRLLT